MPQPSQTQPSPAERSGGTLLVDCLVESGASIFTCLPGESFLPVLDAIYERQAAGQALPRFVTTRHESAAANMAEAAGKLTGRAGVCFVTRGPGATHASIGLHTAYQDGTPLVLVIGQVRRAHLGRQAFQEMDYSLVFGSSAKAVVDVDSAARIPEHVARAWSLAHEGRPGPVVLVLPEDVLEEPTTAGYLAPPLATVPGATQADLDALAARIEAAERPLFVIGGPGWTDRVGRQVLDFAERAGVPVAAGFRWQSMVDNRRAAYVGYLGLGCSPALRAAAARADLLVALGPRLDDPTTDGFALVDARDPDSLVFVSQSASELTRTAIPGLAIQAGLSSVAADLDKRGMETTPARAAWLAELTDIQRDFRTRPAQRAEPDLAAIVEEVRAQVPDDAIITTGAGNYPVWVQRYFEFRSYNTQLAPRSGAMGYGIPAAMAAAALYPDRVVVTFAGDGCFQMNAAELATMVREHLRIVVVVVNNGMYATIRMHQERRFPGHVIATDLANPDFVAFAEAFGLPAARVRRTAEFGPALSAALAQDGPSLIEVQTDPRQLTPDLRLEETR